MATQSLVNNSVALRVRSSDHDIKINNNDYVIEGSFDNAIFEKYDELLVKVNEILSRMYVKT